MEQKLRNSLTAFLCTIALCTIQAQALSDSLIAHFPMDGSPDDVSGILMPTVTSGTPTFCTNRFGDPNSAACFDGASFWSYGDVLDVGISDFTISVWVNVDSVRLPFEIQPGFVSEGCFIAGKGNTIYANPVRAGYSLFGSNNGGQGTTLSGMTGNNTNDVRITMTDVATDTWMHLAFSRCSDHQLIHVNGVIVADSIVPSPRNLNVNTVFSIGAMNRDPSAQPDSEWLIGSVDDLRIYKGRCLSQAEIDTLAYDLLTVGIPSAEESLELRMSPNPASRLLRIDLPAPHQLTSSIVALNALGQQTTLRTNELTMTRDAVRSLTVDVSGLPIGAYYVVVPTERGRLHGMFVKE